MKANHAAPAAPEGRSPGATGAAVERCWTAILLAGQRPGVDPLARLFGKTSKALVPIVGRAMVARVTETLLASNHIRRIIVLTQDPDALRPALGANPRVELQHSGGGISASILATTMALPDGWPVLVTTADHPLLTAGMIATFIDRAGDADVAVAVVERHSFFSEGRDSQRTWLKFRDGAFSGANLFILRNPKSHPALRLWAQAEQDRKSAFRLLRHFGPALAARALTRTISLEAAIERAGQRLGLSARLVVLDDAEAAIDVDKIGDYRLAETILVTRELAERNRMEYGPDI